MAKGDAMQSRNVVQLLNANQYCAMLGIVRNTLNKMVRTGQVEEGKHYLVLPNGLKRYFPDLDVFAPTGVTRSGMVKNPGGNSTPQASLPPLPKGARIRI